MTQHAMPSVVPHVGAKMGDTIRELPERFGRLADRPRVIAALACVLLLVPFLSKPLHIDDPMYVWAAENILSKPLDPYGFAVNWRSTLTPMADEMKNPPLVCYYLAGAMTVLGRSEQALHLAMLLPAIGVVLGTYELARLMGSRPLLACGTLLATPVFLLSSTTIMCDVAMVCAYVWAVWFWVAGLKRDKLWMLVVASSLIAVSTLTKYFGVTLFPLLIAYGLMAKRRPGTWMLPLLIPTAILVTFHYWSKALYGQSLLMDAAGYATTHRWHGTGRMLGAVLTGLSFSGGCCAAVVMVCCVVQPRMLAKVAGLAFAIGALLLTKFDPIVAHSVMPGGGPMRWWFVFQMSFWVACGFAMFAVLLRHVATNWRSPDHILLGLWIIGTFCFAVFVNWNVAARSILPMAPPAAILVATMWTKRLESSPDAPRLPWRPWVALAPMCALALLLCAADASLARTQLDAANRITDALASDSNTASSRAVYFSGHWGFQHYMEHAGAKPIDKKQTNLAVGDVVIIPENNTGLIGLPPDATRTAATVELAPMPLVSTMRPHTDAGFYSDVWGPLPFAFGPVPSEAYQVLVVTRPLVQQQPPRK